MGVWQRGRGKEARPPYTSGCGQNAETEGLLCMKSPSILPRALAAPRNRITALTPSSLAASIHTPPHTQTLTTQICALWAAAHTPRRSHTKVTVAAAAQRTQSDAHPSSHTHRPSHPQQSPSSSTS